MVPSQVISIPSNQTQEKIVDHVSSCFAMPAYCSNELTKGRSLPIMVSALNYMYHQILEQLVISEIASKGKTNQRVRANVEFRNLS